MTDPTKEKSRPWSEVALNLVLDCEPKLFCGHGGRPHIYITGNSLPWPLASRRVKGWIAGVCWEKQQHLLYEREIRRILLVLENKAWNQCSEKDLDPFLWAAVESEPLLEVVLDLMNSHDNDRYENKMALLHRDLTKRAKDMEVSTSAKSWPKSPAAMSAKLWKHRDTLRDLGVEFERDHKRHANIATLKRTIERGCGGGVCDRQNNASNESTDGHSIPKVGNQAILNEDSQIHLRLQQIKETYE